MPTVIDELAMTLSLDPSKFQEGAKQAESASQSMAQKILNTLNQIEQETARHEANAAARAKQTATQQEEHLRRHVEKNREASRAISEEFSKVGDAIKRAGIELLAFMGIEMTVHGMERMFMDISKTNAQVGYLATGLGVSSRELTEFGMAAKGVGANLDDISQAFATIQMDAQNLSHKAVTTWGPVLQSMLGMDFQKAPGVAKSPTDLISEIIKRFDAKAKAQGWDPERRAGEAAFLAQELHLTPGMARVFNAGPERWEASRKEAARIGGTPEEATKASQEMLTSFGRIKDTIGTIGEAITTELSPKITAISNQIYEWLLKNRGWIEEYIIGGLKAVAAFLQGFYDDMVKAFNSQPARVLGRGIGEVTSAINDAVKATVGWQRALEILFGVAAGYKVFSWVRSALGVAPAAAGGAAAEAEGAAAGAAAGGAARKPRGSKPGFGALLGGLGIGLEWYSWMQDEDFKNDITKMGHGDFEAGKKGWAPVADWFKGIFGNDLKKGSGTWDRNALDWLTGPDPAAPTTFGRGDEAPELKRIRENQERQLKIQEEQLQLERERLDQASMPGLPPSTGQPARGEPGFVPEGNYAPVATNKAITPGVRGLLDTIADRESGGNYGARPSPGHSAWGRYQFMPTTWNEVATLTGRREATPENQDFNAAFLARREYARRTRRDLDQDIHDPARWDDVVAALRGTWVSFPGGSQAARGATMDDFRNRLRRHMEAEKAASPAPALDNIPARTKDDRYTAPQKESSISNMFLPEYSLGAGNAARRQFASASSVDQSRSSQTHIGNVTVVTQATEADGIARDIRGALKKYDYAVHADTGLA